MTKKTIAIVVPSLFISKWRWHVDAGGKGGEGGVWFPGSVTTTAETIKGE